MTAFLRALILGTAGTALYAQTFADVPTSSPYYSAAELFWQRGITAGCGIDAPSGKVIFCPTPTITRGQVAIFVVRSIYSALYGDGESFSTPTSQQYFNDVPSSHPYYRYVQVMGQLGISAGCGNGNYCPDDTLTNSQISIFALRAQMARDNGGSSVAGIPPSCGSSACSSLNHFADVPTSNPFHDWIEMLYTKIGTQSSLACSPGNYCPDIGAPRGQMAVDVSLLALNGGTGIAADMHPKYSIASPSNNSTLQYGNGGAVTFTINSNAWPLTLSLSYVNWGNTDIGSYTVCAQGNCGSQSSVTISGLQMSDTSHRNVYAWLIYPNRIGMPTRYSTPSGTVTGVMKEYIRLGERIIAIENTGGGETITAPAISGPMTVSQGSAATYTATGASSNAGHALQYFFTWGDSTTSGWIGSTTASHSWNRGGTFTVTVQARCAVDTSAVSAISANYTVTIPEIVTTPSVTGVSAGNTGVNYTFTASGATSNWGHSLQYLFTWGDGTNSGWVSSSSATHSWSSGGVFGVTVQARCSTHTGTSSGLSVPWNVSISTTGGPPSATMLTAMYGSGASKTFQIRFDGVSSALSSGTVLITGPGSGSCLLSYDRATSVITINANAGWQTSAYLGATPTGSAVLGNNQCELSVGGSYASTSANSVTLNLALSFNPNWQGALDFYLSAVNAAGYSVNQQYCGYWMNDQTYITVGPILPRNQAGSGATFTITANGGAAPLWWASIVLSSSAYGVDANQSCFLQLSYYPSFSVISLSADDATNGNYSWVGSATLSDTANPYNPVLSNSQCTVNTAASTVIAAGNGVYLNVAMTFNGSWRGMKYFYMSDGNTGGGAIASWPYMGYWQVQ